MIVFEPLLPWPALAVLAVAAAAILAPSLRAGRPESWMRAGAVLSLAALLAGPAWERRTPAPGADVVLLVRDRTPSASIAGRQEILDAAETALERRLAALPGVEVRRIQAPADPASAIADAAAAVPAGRLAAVFLVSDGQMRPPPDGALPAGVPIHLMLPGQAVGIDRRVRVLSPPPYAIVGRPVEVEAVVEDLGANGSASEIEVRLQGAAERVESLRVRPGVPFRIPLTPVRAGPLHLGIEAPPLAREAGTENNRIAIEIPALRDRLRVLLLSGEAHPGTRAWRRLLRGDPAIDLVHLMILRTLEQDDQTPPHELSLIPFPVRELFEERLPTFDLVVLDRFRNLPGLLPPAYIERLAQRVRDGGALLAVLGPEAAGEHTIAVGMLGEILPLVPHGLQETSFVPRRPDARAGHPILRGLDSPERWGPWGRYVEATARPDARVLLTAPDGAPLLAISEVAQGRVAALASDHLWWWGRGHEGGGPETELSRRLVHWLLREPDLEEQDLRLVRDGASWRIVRRDAAGTPGGMVEAEGPDGRVRRLTLQAVGPDLAEAALDAPPTPGLWRLRHGDVVRTAVVAEPDPAEWADLRADPTPSAPWRQGGGHAWTGRGDGLPALRRTAIGSSQAGPGWLGIPRTDARTEARIRTHLPPAVPAALAAALVLLAWQRDKRGSAADFPTAGRSGQTS
jgi:hypothetical protein